EDGIRDFHVTGVQTCALPIFNYLELTGQTDDEGKKVSTNTDSDGRYHSNWLNMMYPRLKLARNLMKDDGVIFISIDDHEQANLRSEERRVGKSVDHGARRSFK